MSAIINRTQYWCNAKNMRCNTFTLMIASPRLAKSKISMLKLDTIRKRKERKTYNLKYKIEQLTTKKKNTVLYLIVEMAIGIVITYLLLAKKIKRKATYATEIRFRKTA
jgi:O6-methylguanine-DNA--protein-cysteine methyltransferase